MDFPTAGDVAVGDHDGERGRSRIRTTDFPLDDCRSTAASADVELCPVHARARQEISREVEPCRRPGAR